jgi:hypothetical protein
MQGSYSDSSDAACTPGEALFVARSHHGNDDDDQHAPSVVPSHAHWDMSEYDVNESLMQSWKLTRCVCAAARYRLFTRTRQC